MTDDGNDDDPQKLLEELFGPVLYSYTTEQAVEDGVLVYVGDVGPHKVYFTATLMAEGYEDQARRIALVNKGLSLLRQPDPEDSPTMKLRVIERADDPTWVIAEPGKLTYMKASDY